MYVCILFYGFYFDQIYKEYGLEFIDDDSFLTIIGATASLFGGFSKLFSGYLMDLYSFKSIFRVIVIAIFIHITTLQLTVRNKWSYLVSTLVIMSCFSALNAMMPVLIL